MYGFTMTLPKSHDRRPPRLRPQRSCEEHPHVFDVEYRRVLALQPVNRGAIVTGDGYERAAVAKKPRTAIAISFGSAKWPLS